MTDAPTPQLTVRKLTLFSHGVANLSLSAEIEDDVDLHLSFPERHMNDVLKTLTVVDTSAGQIGSISYEAPSQLNRNPPTLQVLRGEALTSLLRNAQGAKVIVKHREAVTGTVLGLQELTTQGGDRDGGEGVKALHLVLMQGGCRMLTFDVTEIDSVEFMDEQIQKQLERRMQAALTELRARNNKNVTISARGSGKRAVMVNYAVESPVPKLTYRFLLKPSDDEQSSQQTVFIQGWAIVDNPTDEDLQDIDVSIVSGLPISFQHDLYGERFVERPREEVPVAAGYNRPSQATFGMAGGRVLVRRGRGALPPRKQLATKGARFSGQGSSDSDDTSKSSSDGEEEEQVEELGTEPDWQDLVMNGAPGMPAETTEVGDLFEYNIPVKVTIKALESALVPLIMREVEGGRVDVYSHKVRESNTLSAVRIRNSTEASFEGGPVAVYERSRLVGEGMLKACRPGSEQFLPYSVNLDCLAEMKQDVVDGDVVSMVALGGYFKTTREREHVKRYLFRNVKKEEMDLYVLHDMAAGFSLHSATVTRKGAQTEGQASVEGNEHVEEAVKPVSVSKDVARYRLRIGWEEFVVLRVSERKREATSYKIRKHCTQGMIGKWRKEGAVGKKTAEKMEEVLKVEVELVEVKRKIREYVKKLERSESSQLRFRENLSAVGGLKESKKYRDDALIGRLLKGLAESESTIEETEALLKDAEEHEAALKREVEVKIGEFGRGELREE